LYQPINFLCVAVLGECDSICKNTL